MVGYIYQGLKQELKTDSLCVIIFNMKLLSCFGVGSLVQSAQHKPSESVVLF